MPVTNMPRPVFYCQCGNHAWTALTLGFITLVSPQDAHFLEERAWRAYQLKSRRAVYAIATQKSIKLHRLILRLNDPTLLGDHENKNGLDNRRPNLRPASRSQNARNVQSHRDSTSRFLGVSWNSKKNSWMAQIYVKGKTKYLGLFKIEEEAARAYDLAASQHAEQFANLNFP
jgi:AP2 domain